MKQLPSTRAGRDQRPACVVTTEHDVTADRVLAEMTRRGAPVVRVDLRDFPRRVRLDASLSGDCLGGTLRTAEHSVRLSEIGAVWWWHPEPARIPAEAGMRAEEADWASREANAGFAGVLAALPDCLHINHPAATYAAQNKADVLVQARRSGLMVPPTWIGNTPSSAQDFAAEQPTVYKTLHTPQIRYADGTQASSWTRPVTPATLGDRVAAGAHQLQRRIDKVYEVRLIVVGAQMVAARIDAGSQAARDDFRADYAALTYQPTELPASVRSGVASLMAHYHLLYAALDLLVDAAGVWWLCDLNPAGQYGWIEDKLPHLGISAALADLLAHPRPSSTRAAQRVSAA